MIGNNKVLAVITARANSVGLPQKNYREFCGKPLIEWSILAAVKSKYIDFITISSNCPHVKDVSLEFIKNYNSIHGKDAKKVYFIDRPNELATPISKNEEALIHAAQWLEEKYEENPKYIVNLQPTSPLRKKYLIDDCLEKLYDSGLKSLLTVSEHTPLVIQVDSNGNIKWHFDRLNRKMRQDFSPEELYLNDDGCLYITESNVLFDELCRLDSHPFVYLNNKYSSYQIDTDDDFIILEAIKKQLDKSNQYI